ncbi:MAG: hypothetical protein JWP32_1494, partial [Schumannella sp.]|nr:hypothetical protein [Schumannella sp.]
MRGRHPTVEYPEQAGSAAHSASQRLSAAPKGTALVTG